MAETNKILGQSNPAATTWTSLYLVPASTQAVVSRLSVFNDHSDATYVYAGVIPSAGATVTPTATQFILCQAVLAAKSSLVLDLPITLGAGDRFSVWAGGASFSFSLWGVEIT